MKHTWHVIIEKPNGSKVREEIGPKSPDSSKLRSLENRYSTERLMSTSGQKATVINLFRTEEP